MAGRLLILAAFGLGLVLAARLLRAYFADAKVPTRFERRDVDVEDSRALLVEFTSPFCYDCQVALPVLAGLAEAHSASLAVIDARERPDLAAKYGIRLTPTILVVDGKGAIRGGWLGNPPQHEVESALVAALATA